MFGSTDRSVVVELVCVDIGSRADWRQRVIDEVPALRDLIERLHPLPRAIAFATSFDVGTQLVKETLTRNAVLDLIMQHTSAQGLRGTRKAIQEEAHVECAFLFNF